MGVFDRMKKMSKEELENLTKDTSRYGPELTEDEKQAVEWITFGIAYDIAQRDIDRYGIEYAEKEFEYYNSLALTEKGFLAGYDCKLDSFKSDQ